MVGYCSNAHSIPTYLLSQSLDKAQRIPTYPLETSNRHTYPLQRLPGRVRSTIEEWTFRFSRIPHKVTLSLPDSQRFTPDSHMPPAL